MDRLVALTEPLTVAGPDLKRSSLYAREKCGHTEKDTNVASAVGFTANTVLVSLERYLAIPT